MNVDERSILSVRSELTSTPKLNVCPHSSDEVNGKIDELGPVKPFNIRSCSRYPAFFLFDRDYHSGLLSVTSLLGSPELGVRRPGHRQATGRSATHGDPRADEDA